MRRIASFTFIACLAGALAACGDDPVTTSDKGPTPDGDGGVTPGSNITIGLMLPLTGGAEQFGKASKQAAELAAEEINKVGVLGGKIEFVTTNEEGDGPEAKMKAFVDNAKMMATIGPMTSGKSKAMMPELKGKLVAISPSATSPDLTDADDGDMFFRTAPSDAFQAKAAVSYGLKEFKLKKAVTVYREDTWGTALNKAFVDGWKAGGGTVLAEVKYVSQEKYDTFDFGPTAAAIFKDKPEVVFFATYTDDGGKLLAAIAADQGYTAVKSTVKFLGSDGQATPDFAGVADPTVVEGRWMGTVGGPPKDAANYKKFADAFRKKFGLAATEDPSLYSESTYDAIYLIAMAIEKAGKADRMALKDALSKVSGPAGTAVNAGDWAAAKAAAKAGDANFEGASGPIDFDAKGDCKAANYSIYTIKGGKIEIVVPSYKYE